VGSSFPARRGRPSAATRATIRLTPSLSEIKRTSAFIRPGGKGIGTQWRNEIASRHSPSDKTLDLFSARYHPHQAAKADWFSCYVKIRLVGGQPFQANPPAMIERLLQAASDNALQLGHALTADASLALSWRFAHNVGISSRETRSAQADIAQNWCKRSLRSGPQMVASRPNLASDSRPATQANGRSMESFYCFDNLRHADRSRAARQPDHHQVPRTLSTSGKAPQLGE